MTEDEAKQKWCPMRRMTQVGNVSFHNTEPNAPFTLNCIGSDCMMWRTTGFKLMDNGVEILDRNNYRANNAVKIPQGYCGLGGKL